MTTKSVDVMGMEYRNLVSAGSPCQGFSTPSSGGFHRRPGSVWRIGSGWQ
ncbi:hypothetical protein [Mycobacteroides abscessus]|nr:hypothetical protein [Mycobacteroides abscessus]